MARRDWRDDANCRDADVEEFFSEGTQTSRRRGRPKKGEVFDPDAPVAVALKYCADCSVVDECLAFALRNDVEFGVFGGLTPYQREATGRVQRADKDRFGVDARAYVIEKRHEREAAQRAADEAADLVWQNITEDEAA